MSGDCTISELKKRHGNKCRFILFLEKFQRNEIFEDFKGNKFKLQCIEISKYKIYHQETKVFLETNNTKLELTENLFPDLEVDFLSIPDGEKISVTTENGNIIYGSNLRKTKDIGGSSPYNRQKNTIQSYIEYIAKNQIPDNIILSCNYTGKTYQENKFKIDCIKEIKSSCHADMVFESDDNKHLFFSLKHGTNNNADPDDFQHYTGITKLKNHPEIKDFVNQVINILYTNSFPIKYPEKTNYRKNIIDTNLKNQSLYGIDYGNDKGLNNVNYILQGYPTFDIKEDYLYISCEKIFCNGDVPHGVYEPYLYCRYGSDRGKTNPILQNARFMIAPYKYRHTAIDINNTVDSNYTERFFNYDK